MAGVPRTPGPPKMPANVIRMRGNRSELTEAELVEREAEEVKARPLRPQAPADLSPHARECWKRLAPELERLGMLTVLDGESFRLACETYALAVYSLEAMRPRKADGSPDARVKTPEVLQVDRVHGGQLKRHSAFATYMQASREFRAWCVEFGLSPSARASLRPGANRPPAGVERDEDDDGAFFGT